MITKSDAIAIGKQISDTLEKSKAMYANRADWLAAWDYANVVIVGLFFTTFPLKIRDSFNGDIDKFMKEIKFPKAE